MILIHYKSQNSSQLITKQNQNQIRRIAHLPYAYFADVVDFYGLFYAD